MGNALRQWADAELSRRLPDIRAAGEGPEVEFKEQWPDKAVRIAQALAAFGTSGGGTLFIGVSDNGDLIGIAAADGDARDDLFERVHGVVDTIRPRLNADILFAVETATPVLAIRVPAQDEPVFYHDHRPYIRDGRRSRPATPEEVKERVWSHPSSECKREMEKVTLQQAQTIANMGRSFAEQSAKSWDARKRPFLEGE